MIVKYELMPEAYKGNGKFSTKEGTVGELVYETGMLMSSDFDKVIPKLEQLNELFMKGSYPRAAEWEPFTIDEDEYDEVCDYLCGLKLLRPFRKR